MMVKVTWPVRLFVVSKLLPVSYMTISVEQPFITLPDSFQYLMLVNEMFPLKLASAAEECIN